MLLRSASAAAQAASKPRLAPVSLLALLGFSGGFLACHESSFLFSKAGLPVGRICVSFRWWGYRQQDFRETGVLIKRLLRRWDRGEPRARDDLVCGFGGPFFVHRPREYRAQGPAELPCTDICTGSAGHGFSYTAIRNSLAKAMDQVNEGHAPIIITRQKGRTGRDGLAR